jgi:hypothetical protein
MSPGLCILCGFVGVCIGIVFWNFIKLIGYWIESNKRVKIKTRLPYVNI